MKLTPLLENELAQTRTDLLMWQERFMDELPDSFDVQLDKRKMVAGEGFAVVVYRNGKELFYADTSKASHNFYQTCRIYGEHIQPFVMLVTDFETSVKVLMIGIDLRRKLGNLLPNMEVILSAPELKKARVTVMIQPPNNVTGSGVSVVYKHQVGTYYVKDHQQFMGTSDVGSSKDELKAMGIAEKRVKELLVRG